MARQILRSALLLAAAWSGTALAQDVVVMRRTLVKPLYDQTHWDVGAWSGGSTCSDAAQQTRVVRCLDNVSNAVLPDTSCRGTKPAAQGQNPVHSGCTYAWTYSLYGPYAEACSDLTYHTRTATCTRSGGGSTPTTSPDASLCTASKEALREDVANYAGCSFVWQTTQGTCSGGMRNQTSVCQRSGGSSKTTTTVDSDCTTTKPAAQIADSACAAPVSTLKIANGTFSGGYSSWLTYTWGTSSLLTGTLDGTSAAALSIGNSASGVQLYQIVSVKPGETNTIGFDYALSPGTNPGSLLFTVRKNYSDSVAQALVGTNPDVTATKTTHGTVTFTVPAGVSQVYVIVHSWSLGSNPTQVLLTNIKGQ